MNSLYSYAKLTTIGAAPAKITNIEIIIQYLRTPEVSKSSEVLNIPAVASNYIVGSPIISFNLSSISLDLSPNIVLYANIPIVKSTKKRETRGEIKSKIS